MTGTGAAPGHPVPLASVPSARHPPPSATFFCIARNDGRIFVESIWFTFHERHNRSPRRPTYPALTTYPPLISCWIVRFHMCTVGSNRFGSNTRTAGALLATCAGGVRKLEGFAEGAGSAFGNPAPSRTSGTAPQPGGVESAPCEPLKLLLHVNVCPGTLVATLVTWNV